MNSRSFSNMIKSIRPRLVTFNVAGTLMATKLEERFIKICPEYNLKLQPEKMAKTLRNNFEDIIKKHPIYGSRTYRECRQWWIKHVQYVFKDQNAKGSKYSMEEMAERLMNEYSTKLCFYKDPVTNDLLEFLKQKNVTLGVISNVALRLEKLLVNAEIRQYFSFVLPSIDYGVPYPSFFKMVLKMVNDDQNKEILPHEAMYISDSVNYNYLGAKEAGWNALLIKHTYDKIDEKKVRKKDVFGNLEKLQEHFEKMFETNSNK